MPGLHRNIKEGETVQLINRKGDTFQIAIQPDLVVDVNLVQKSGNYVALEIVAHHDIEIRVKNKDGDKPRPVRATG